MALIPCKECGKEISTLAKSCPHCGAPNVLPVLAPPPPPLVRRGFLQTIAFFLLTIIFLFVAGIAYLAHNNNASDNVTSSKPTEFTEASTPANGAASAPDSVSSPSSQSAANAAPAQSGASEPQPAAPASKPAATPTPKPYYSLAQPDALYGYAPALSNADQNAGIGASALVMVRYLGHAVKTGEPVFDLVENNGFTRVWCLKHCAFAQSVTYTSWGHSQPQYTTVGYGTILWEITQDIAHGALDRASTKRLTVPIDLVEDHSAPQSAPALSIPPSAASGATPSASAPALSIPPSANPVAAASAPNSAPSFDCSKATRPDAKTICTSPELSALDRQWAAYYREKKAVAPDAAVTAWRRAFLQQRRACLDDAQCIAAAYRQALNSSP